MTKKLAWINQAKRLYLWSFIGWLSVTLLVLVNGLMGLLSENQAWAGQQLTQPTNPLYLMLAAGPGIVYFYLQSRKLNTSKPEESSSIYGKIMLLQIPTGWVATAGAFLGLLPFLVNFIGFFTIIGFENLWINVPLIFPWASLYGYVATFIISLRLNKRRISNA